MFLFRTAAARDMRCDVPEGPHSCGQARCVMRWLPPIVSLARCAAAGHFSTPDRLRLFGHPDVRRRVCSGSFAFHCSLHLKKGFFYIRSFCLFAKILA